MPKPLTERRSVGVLLLTFALAIVGGSCTRAAQKEPAKGGEKSAAQWEYCTLRKEDAFAGWYTSKEAVETAENSRDPWMDLAKKLKLPLPKTVTDDGLRMIIFDHLGSQGWELTTHTGGGGASLYTFKRRK